MTNLAEDKFTTHAGRHMPPALTDREYLQWAALIAERLGLKSSVITKPYIAKTVFYRLLSLGLDSYESYFQLLHDQEQGVNEWVNLVDLLTIHETRFYRHPESLEYVAEHIRQRHATSASLQLWSVGCSTGEEAYSLSILTHQVLESYGSKTPYLVLGSDISGNCLEKAKTGLYHRRQLVNLNPAMVSRYFEPGNADYVRIGSDVAGPTCFKRYDILDNSSQDIGIYDVIYCQNLLIYLQPERRRQALDQLVSHLAHDGILILGAGEAHEWRSDKVTRVRHASINIYRRDNY